MQIKWSLPLMLTLCSAIFFADAQQSSPSKKRCRFNTINFEQGLLNNGTTNLLTDVSGFTWVSTFAGIQRYNGYRLEQVNPVLSKDTIHITNPVYFFRLRNGLIWICYKHGILSYNPYSCAFKKVHSLHASGNFYFPFVPLFESNEGIWCMKEKVGIVILDSFGIQTKTFTDLNSTTIDNIVHSQAILLNNIIATNDSFIFIRNGKNEILQINTTTHRFSKIPFNIGEIYSLACNGHNLYVMANTGLQKINISNGQITKTILSVSVTNETINTGSVFFADDNQLLVSFNRHLYEFDTALTAQKEFTTLGKEPVLGNGYIQHIYSDQLKRIWLLTNDDIKRIQNVDIPFRYFAYPNTKNNFIRTLYYDEEKHILLAGCYNGGLQLYDTLGNGLWEKPIITQAVKNIIGIEKISADDYLVITLEKGWFNLHLSTKQITPFALLARENKLDPHNNIFSNNLQRVNDTTIFIATTTNVFSCILKNKKVQSVTPILPFINNPATITSFAYTSDKTLWAGTSEGLVYRLNTTQNLQTLTIPNNYLVRCISEDVIHNIWVGTDKGLYVYNSEGKLLKQFSNETGLLNDCIYALLPVTTGGVFTSSNLGLSYISPDGIIKNYPKELGLQDNEFNTNAALKTSSGRFYFGGVNGITSFYPSALSLIKDNPILNFTKIIINDSPYTFPSGKWKGDSILLDYYQNYLHIDIAALGLLNANEYLYKYRLHGFENEWQTTYQPTGIKYVLEPGKYTFEVICSSILTSEKKFYKSFVIIIHPPWWQTWWFRILACLFAIAVLVSIIQQINQKKYRQKIQLLQMQQEIQHERERISRDLHDNLGAYASAIASDAESISIDSLPNKNILTNLKANASEIMTNLRDTIWALHKESISVTGISDRFKNYIKKIEASYPGKEIIVNENIDSEQMLLPTVALNIYRIMQEALHNALKHSNADTIIILIKANGNVNISIADNGKGFASADNELGYGIQNMLARAKEVNLNLLIETNVPSGTIINISTNKQ